MKPDVKISELPLPSIHVSSKRKRQLRQCGEGSARDAIGEITPGCEIFAITNGQFSMIDILNHVLETTGPATLDIATWTAADGDIRKAHAFLVSGMVTDIRLIVDPSFKSRKPEFCNLLTSIFKPDSIRTVPLHGKFSNIRNDKWNIAIRSSMNLNVNKRIETLEISDDAKLSDFMKRFADDVFLANSPHANFTSQSKSINNRHDQSALPPFGLPPKLCF